MWVYGSIDDFREPGVFSPQEKQRALQGQGAL